MAALFRSNLISNHLETAESVSAGVACPVRLQVALAASLPELPDLLHMAKTSGHP